MPLSSILTFWSSNETVVTSDLSNMMLTPDWYADTWIKDIHVDCSYFRLLNVKLEYFVKPPAFKSLIYQISWSTFVLLWNQSTDFGGWTVFTIQVRLTMPLTVSRYISGPPTIVVCGSGINILISWAQD